MGPIFKPEVEFNFKEQESAPVSKENQKITQKHAEMRDRLHLFSYGGKQGHDYYAIAAEKIECQKEKGPSLNVIKRFFHVLVPSGQDGVYYKISRESLKKRLGITREDLAEFIDKKGVIIKEEEFKAKIQAKLAQALTKDIEEFQERIENFLEIKDPDPNNKKSRAFYDLLLTKDLDFTNRVFQNFIQKNFGTDKPKRFKEFLDKQFQNSSYENVQNQASVIRHNFNVFLQEEKKKYVTALKNFQFIPNPMVSGKEIAGQEILINSLRGSDRKDPEGGVWPALKEHFSKLCSKLLENSLSPTPNSEVNQELSFAIGRFVREVGKVIKDDSNEEKKGFLRILQSASASMSIQLKEFFNKVDPFIPLETKKEIIECIIEQKRNLISTWQGRNSFADDYPYEKGTTNLDLLSAVIRLKNSEDKPITILGEMHPDDAGLAFQFLSESEKLEVIGSLKARLESVENVYVINEIKKFQDSIKKEMTPDQLVHYFPEK